MEALGLLRPQQRDRASAYEVDPLVCPRCGGEMHVVSFITEPALIRRIVDHLSKRERVCRPPPPFAATVASIA